MSYKGIGKETLKILENGFYTSPSGKVVSIQKGLHLAVKNTLLYRPEDRVELENFKNITVQSNKTEITIVNDSTQKRAFQLSQQYDDLLVLSFASARNPSGGFLKGAKGQEEDIARCSGVYSCLLRQPEYYEKNRKQDSLLYLDYLIYSPKVPWFRKKSHDLCESPFYASIITAPAPNTGQLLRREGDWWPEIENTLYSRAAFILDIARKHNHRNFLLGAWGCGVFQNDPEMVAKTFSKLLNEKRFINVFNYVEFAIYDRVKKSSTFTIFENVFNLQ